MKRIFFTILFVSLLNTNVFANSGPATKIDLTTQVSGVLPSANGGSVEYLGTDSGSSTAYIVTGSVGPTVLSNGIEVSFVPSNANSTASPTVIVNGLGSSLSIVTCGTNTLNVGDISTTTIASLLYNGTSWELLNPIVSICGSNITNIHIGPLGGNYVNVGPSTTPPSTWTFNLASPTTTATSILSQYSGCLGVSGGVISGSGSACGGSNPTAATIGAVQGSACGGNAQAETLTLSPAITSLSAYTNVNCQPIASNTATAPTLAVNGLAATTITKCGGKALVGGDISFGTIAYMSYNGTTFDLTNPQSVACEAVNSPLFSKGFNSPTSITLQTVIDFTDPNRNYVSYTNINPTVTCQLFSGTAKVYLTTTNQYGVGQTVNVAFTGGCTSANATGVLLTAVTSTYITYAKAGTLTVTADTTGVITGWEAIDATGNGNNCIFGGTTGTPSIVSYATSPFSGVSGISFSGNNKQYCIFAPLNIVSGTLNSPLPQTLIFYVAPGPMYPLTTTTTALGLWGPSTSDNTLATKSLVIALTTQGIAAQPYSYFAPQPQEALENFATAPSTPDIASGIWGGPHCYAFTPGDNGEYSHIYVDGAEVAYSSGGNANQLVTSGKYNAPSGTGFYQFGGTPAPYGYGSWFNGIAYQIVTSTTALTSVQIQPLCQQLATYNQTKGIAQGYLFQPPNNTVGSGSTTVGLTSNSLVSVGDSQTHGTQGTITTAITYPGVTTANLSTNLVEDEAQTIPSSPYTVTATNSTTFQQNIGVMYTSSVPSTESQGLTQVSGYQGVDTQCATASSGIATITMVQNYAIGQKILVGTSTGCSGLTGLIGTVLTENGGSFTMQTTDTTVVTTTADTAVMTGEPAAGQYIDTVVASDTACAVAGTGVATITMTQSFSIGQKILFGTSTGCPGLNGLTGVVTAQNGGTFTATTTDTTVVTTTADTCKISGSTVSGVLSLSPGIYTFNSADSSYAILLAYQTTGGSSWVANNIAQSGRTDQDWVAARNWIESVLPDQAPKGVVTLMLGANNPGVTNYRSAILNFKKKPATKTIMNTNITNIGSNASLATGNNYWFSNWQNMGVDYLCGFSEFPPLGITQSVASTYWYQADSYPTSAAHAYMGYLEAKCVQSLYGSTKANPVIISSAHIMVPSDNYIVIPASNSSAFPLLFPEAEGLTQIYTISNQGSATTTVSTQHDSVGIAETLVGSGSITSGTTAVFTIIPLAQSASGVNVVRVQ